MIKPNLDNPFVVASCHQTGTREHIDLLYRRLSRYKSYNGYDPYPGGLILKSISELGGDGYPPSKEKQRKMWYDKEYHIIRYSDGSKQEELLLPDIALSLLAEAKKFSPSKTKIGASILLGEDSSLQNVLLFARKGADFLELNTKYLSRRYQDKVYTAQEKASLSFDDCKKQILNIITKCTCPIWIKFARDIVWLRTKEIVQLTNYIHRDDVAFVFANTSQVNVMDYNKTDNGRAVVFGKTLFSETFDIIKHFRPILPEKISIVASGGITAKRQAIECLKAGASAIELCNYFDEGKRDLAEWKAAI